MGTKWKANAAVVAGLVTGCALYGLAGAQEAASPQAIPAPSEEAVRQSRLDAALADRAEDERRVDEANRRYADEQLTAAVPREYVVSFSDPVGALQVFEAAAADPSIVLHRAFVWLPHGGTANPMTGMHEFESSTWDPQEELSKTRSAAREFLDTRLAALNRMLLKVPLAPDAALLEQRDEVLALLSSLDSITLYGIECTCSPDSVDRFASAAPDVELRAVELTENVEYPLWPRDPFRERVIESGGSYGL